MNWKRLLTGAVVFSLSIFIFGGFPAKVSAGCATGYYCFGTTRLDVPNGCNNFGSYCTQKWIETVVNCEATSCTTGREGRCCRSNCTTYGCGVDTNCCAAEVCPAAEACPTYCGYGGGTVPNGSCGTTACGATDPCCPAAGTCTTNCGANASVDDGNCGTTACACIECGPYGSQNCGNWTQTYNCSAPVSGCNDCLVISPWSTCGADHKRTRTCSAYCGGCSGVALVEDCIGTVTGTLFDASDLSFCPGDIGTNAIYASLRYGSQPFGLTGTWPVISLPVSTDANGNYSESVYASTLPAVYNYEYSDLINSGRAAGIKYECQSPVATVTTQAQIVTKDTGFWRVYGGWWQVTGGSVYATDGIESSVPASVTPASNQKLILASSVALGSR